VRLAALALLAAACGGSTTGPGQLRFRNRPPVTLVNDRRPTPKPAKLEPGLVQYYFRSELAEPAVAALTLERSRPAADVNSLGQLPDSSWFTNRRPTAAEVRRGPGRGGQPSPGPLRVDGIKIGGAAIGFTVVDAAGDRFIVKFDERKHPETESSADVIVQRLTWAFGYNVPENDVIEFDCDQLVLADDAKYEDRAGNERKMTQADLDRFLRLVEPASGRCRALSSRFIDGVPAGGVMPHGVRPDDRNDTVPHQDRRVLRGQRVLFAWVDHTDVKPHNSFSSWDERRRHLVHYFLDFGKSLGTYARIDGLVYVGHRRAWSLGESFKSLLSLGLWVPPWETKRLRPAWRGVGFFDSASFSPGRWTPHHRWAPFEAADRFDDYWAGVILMRLGPELVRAAVEAGRYSDPRATEHVTRVLLERRVKLGRWTLSRVAPFEDFEVRGTGERFGLCFDDLWVRYRFGREGITRYRAESFDFEGRRLGESAAAPAGGFRACIPDLSAGHSRDGYTIVRIAARRGSTTVPDVYLHLARDRSRAMTVIGIDRR
jgi:hypothetical protein